MNNETIKKLTHTRLLARNTIYNLLGQVAPLIAAIFAIPLLIHNLGTSRFGVLTLAWMVLGYFGLFDLGLGRVVTMLVGQKLGGEKADEIPAIVWTGTLFMLAIGLVSMIIVLLISPALVKHILKIPADLQQESLRAFIILGCAVPVVTSTAGIRGVLEAHQQFGKINIVRTLNGLYTFLVPLAVSTFSVLLGTLVLFMALGRVLILCLYLVYCFRTVPALKKRVILRTGLARPMFRLGGWMSVSNIIGPVMVYFDRFLIGAWLSVAAVAYYVTPYEVVTKLMLLTAALSRVLFPAFSAGHGVDNRRMTILYSRGIRVLIAALFPVALIFVVFAHPAIQLWLGPEFAKQSTAVMQWLALGVFFNAPGQIAFAMVQAVGRPDLTAKLHLVEAPFYLFALWFLVGKFGIQGAAIAWSLRVFVDTVALLFFVHFVIKKKDAIWRQTGLAFLLATASLAMPMLFIDSYFSIVYFLIIFFASIATSWKFLLLPDEKLFFRQFLLRKKSRANKIVI